MGGHKTGATETGKKGRKGKASFVNRFQVKGEEGCQAQSCLNGEK